MTKMIAALIAACEADFLNDYTETGPGRSDDDEAVAAGFDGDCSITFGMIRGARAELDAMPAEARTTAGELDVRRLRLEPGDMIVMSVRETLRRSDQEHLQKVLDRAFEAAGVDREAHPCLVLDAGKSLALINNPSRALADRFPTSAGELRDPSKLPASELTGLEITGEIAVVEGAIGRMTQAVEEGEELGGGSPMEGVYERLEELTTEQNRRAAEAFAPEPKP